MQVCAIFQFGISCFFLSHSRTVPTPLTPPCVIRHTFPRAHVSPTCRHLITVSVSLRSHQCLGCAIFLCSQCWSHSANFLHQERHCGAAGTDQVSTRAAALCPALWFLDSHSRPSAPSTSHGPATNPSLLTSNLCKLALVHMIMYCRVGSSPRRSCSASSKSPEGLCSVRRLPLASRTAKFRKHDCAGSSSG